MSMVKGYSKSHADSSRAPFGALQAEQGVLFADLEPPAQRPLTPSADNQPRRVPETKEAREAQEAREAHTDRDQHELHMQKALQLARVIKTRVRDPKSKRGARLGDAVCEHLIESLRQQTDHEMAREAGHPAAQ